MTPALVTARLRLRPVEHPDNRELLEHWTSPAVRRFLFDDTILSAAEVTRVIDASGRGFAASGSVVPGRFGSMTRYRIGEQ